MGSSQSTFVDLHKKTWKLAESKKASPATLRFLSTIKPLCVRLSKPRSDESGYYHRLARGFIRILESFAAVCTMIDGPVIQDLTSQLIGFFLALDINVPYRVSEKHIERAGRLVPVTGNANDTDSDSDSDSYSDSSEGSTVSSVSEPSDW